MKLPDIDTLEISLFKELVSNNISLLSTEYIKSIYNKNTLKSITDPFHKDIINFIIQRLKNNIPTSVIRLGDGEMNLLAYSNYPELPNLSRFAALSSIAEQKHTFEPSKTWLTVFEHMMMSAVLEADMIGILGFWRPHIKANNFIQEITHNPRGYWGQWIGLDHILSLHAQLLFKTKIVTSAHLYFSVLKYIDRLLNQVQNVYLITNKKKVLPYLQQKFPKNNFKLIFEPISVKNNLNNEPYFLSEIDKQFPKNMNNSLTLVGAGLWAEFYCTWVKRRGGIAVDIGSGFDLLVGHSVRPIHRFFKST